MFPDYNKYIIYIYIYPSFFNLLLWHVCVSYNTRYDTIHNIIIKKKINNLWHNSRFDNYRFNPIKDGLHFQNQQEYSQQYITHKLATNKRIYS